MIIPPGFIRAMPLIRVSSPSYRSYTMARNSILAYVRNLCVQRGLRETSTVGARQLHVRSALAMRRGFLYKATIIHDPPLLAHTVGWLRRSPWPQTTRLTCFLDPRTGNAIPRHKIAQRGAGPCICPFSLRTRRRAGKKMQLLGLAIEGDARV